EDAMNAVFKHNVLTYGPLFPQRTRNRHNTRADVFNESMREITAAAPLKTDLRIPEFLRVLSGTRQPCSRFVAQLLQQFDLADDARARFHPLSIHGPMIVPVATHASNDCDVPPSR